MVIPSVARVVEDGAPLAVRLKEPPSCTRICSLGFPPTFGSTASGGPPRRRPLQLEDPATEQTVTTVASASVEDCIAAVDAAQAAFGPWAAKSPRERGEILRRAYEIMIREKERIAKIITLENGKGLETAGRRRPTPPSSSAGTPKRRCGVIGQTSMAPSTGARILTYYKPAGVSVLVTPWNFPAAMATRKIGPALAAGCTVVIKPASATPLTMLALMPILEEAGVPKGVVNVVPSEQSGKVVSAMLADIRVRVISFTGSTQVGRVLLKEAAHNVIKPSMELGRNAPFVVFEDADIDAPSTGR